MRTQRLGGVAMCGLAVALALLCAPRLRADNLIWNVAGGGAWDTATANWTGDDTMYADGGVDTVTFNNTAGGMIVLDANHDPAGVFVTAPSGTYTFQGYIFDTGSSGFGISLTNAIVVEVL